MDAPNTPVPPAILKKPLGSSNATRLTDFIADQVADPSGAARASGAMQGNDTNSLALSLDSSPFDFPIILGVWTLGDDSVLAASSEDRIPEELYFVEIVN